jgi:hypothetical protein
MKKVTCFFASFLAVITLNATVRTVSNSPATLAQFNTINAAIAASSSGDTILVHGSPNQYGGFTISSKQLTIIGPGWNPDKNLGFTAVVQGSAIVGTASSNTEIQGLVFVGNLDMFTAPHPDNIKLIRNQFVGVRIHLHQSSTTYNGFLFEGNYFENAQVYGNTTGTTYTNFLFQNNWFTETGCCFSGNIEGFQNTTGVLFNHNLFSSNSGNQRDVFNGGARFINLTNNIFVRRNAATNLSNSTFTNNLTFNTSNNAPWTANGNVNSGGNQENVDPQMTTSVAGNPPSAISDFTIVAGPANNAGSDGKDLGLLYDATGSLNWANSRNSRLPRIFSMNITNPTVSSGGTLTVEVNARKSN